MKKLILLVFLNSPLSATPLICTGDSQTYVRPPLVDSQTYCYQIGQARGSTHVNLGFPSAMSRSSTPSLSWIDTQVPQAIAAGPGCVTVMIGINDGWINPGVPPPWPIRGTNTAQQLHDNLVTGIRQLKAAGNQVTLFTSWAMWSTSLNYVEPAYMAAIKQVAMEEQGGVFLDAYKIANSCILEPSTNWASCNHLYGFDGAGGDYAHPAAPGHVEITSLCARPENATACACHP